MALRRRALDESSPGPSTGEGAYTQSNTSDPARMPPPLPVRFLPQPGYTWNCSGSNLLVDREKGQGSTGRGPRPYQRAETPGDGARFFKIPSGPSDRLKRSIVDQVRSCIRLDYVHFP